MREASAPTNEEARRERVAILQSGGAAELQTVLAGADLCADIAAADDIAAGIRSGELDAAIIGPDALRSPPLAAAIEAQPPWSHFPLLLVAEREELRRDGLAVEALGWMVLLEPPIEPPLLLDMVKAALRSRARQRQAGRDFRLRAEAEAQFREQAQELRDKIRERMNDLRAAHERLVREVGDRRAAEARLRESEERYRHTIELSQQMAWTADADKRLTSASSAFSETTGISPDVDPQVAWLAVVHPEDLKEVAARWNAEPEAPGPRTAEFRMKVADGSYRLFRARSVPKRDEAGQILCWYGYTEDITDQKAAEQAQREAEERYRLAARATDDAVWDHDLLKGEVYWIDSASAFLGFPAGEGGTLASFWLDNIHPEDRERVVANAYGSIEAGLSRWSSEYRFRSRGGHYVQVLDHGFVIRNDAGEPIRAVGSMADVSERRQAEAELKRMQAELIQVSRHSAMGAMASTLAHELNQPLTAVASYVRGGLRLLEGAEEPVPPDVRAALEAAEASAIKAGQIVRGLRELVSRRSGKMKRQDLAKIIEEANVLALVDEQAHGLTHRVVVDPAARWVEADNIQIQQVLINLIRNAIQAMAESPQRHITIATQPGPDHMIEVSVADTGHGLPPGAGGALFSPFKSGKAEGMGIGLSISRTIVEAHGGRIWAEDGPGSGAVFRFTLPAAKESSAAKERRTATKA
jgi:PAS domain S-box-containing protein